MNFEGSLTQDRFQEGNDFHVITEGPLQVSQDRQALIVHGNTFMYFFLIGWEVWKVGGSLGL